MTDSPSLPSRRMLGILNLLSAQGRYKLFEGVDQPGRRAGGPGPPHVQGGDGGGRVAKRSRRVNRGS